MGAKSYEKGCGGGGVENPGQRPGCADKGCVCGAAMMIRRCAHAQPGGHRTCGDQVACTEVSIETGEGGESSPDGSGGKPFLSVVEPEDVVSVGGKSLGGDEFENVTGGDVEGIFADYGEEYFQVVSCGEDGVGSAARGNETEIVVKQVVAESDFDTCRAQRMAGQNRERRRTATHPPKAIPELLADEPSQVWTWDITKLRGSTKGVWFHLYVLIDIDSRYNPLWIVAAHESAELAAEFIAEAIGRNGIAPHTAHADRGTSMTSGLVSEMLTNLGITRSHSRPRASNDNLFSEARFKTLKYLHDFPKSFAKLDYTRVLLEGFFNEYNHIHRHFGNCLAYPGVGAFGTTDAVDEARQITLNEAYFANPARFSRRPNPSEMPTVFFINEPVAESQIN